MLASIYEFPMSDEVDESEESSTDQEPFSIMTYRYNFDTLDEYLTTGEQMAADGRHEESVAILREASDRYGDNANAQYNLGTALLLAVREDLARNELWESLSDEEDLLEQAIVAFQNAIDRDPQMLPAYNNLARALSLHGRKDDALLVWERSLQINPDQEDAKADYEMLRTQLAGSVDEMETRAILLQDTGFDATPAPTDDVSTHSDVRLGEDSPDQGR